VFESQRQREDISSFHTERTNIYKNKKIKLARHFSLRSPNYKLKEQHHETAKKIDFTQEFYIKPQEYLVVGVKKRYLQICKNSENISLIHLTWRNTDDSNPVIK
jgi:hypothetical protein